jgi:hypothetical protein
MPARNWVCTLAWAMESRRNVTYCHESVAVIVATLENLDADAVCHEGLFSS